MERGNFLKLIASCSKLMPVELILDNLKESIANYERNPQDKTAIADLHMNCVMTTMAIVPDGLEEIIEVIDEAKEAHEVLHATKEAFNG